ncbi:DUF222 domain-containing protein [Actinospongicola halichondriae]|uniref:HNH endonuclease n=1 Tax=Actinospongicola halichondriae TaxID=3236844 RepID=UPI003D50F96D
MDVTAALQHLGEAIDAIAAVDATDLSAPERAALLEGVSVELRRLDHQRHVRTGELERSGMLLDLGYRTIAQWQRDRLRCSDHVAGRVGALARDLVHLPTVAKRWAAGEISAEHARLVASARTEGTEELFDEWESTLADHAATLDHAGLRKSIRAWRLHADPDGDLDARLLRDRDAHVSTTFEGAVKADAMLDPIGGASFKDVFDSLVDELFHEDWTEARERLDRKPKMSELRRTNAQRRADALVEMAGRAHRHGTPDGREPRPLISVVTGLDALAEGLAELWNGTVLSPRQLAELLANDPDIERYTFGDEAQPIGYNPAARLYTGRLRAAILLRDRRCTGRGCTNDTRRGAVDHIHPHHQGGRTTPSNGRGACHPCNRTRPQRRFHGDPDPPAYPQRE